MAMVDGVQSAKESRVEDEEAERTRKMEEKAAKRIADERAAAEEEEAKVRCGLRGWSPACE